MQSFSLYSTVYAGCRKTSRMRWPTFQLWTWRCVRSSLYEGMWGSVRPVGHYMLTCTQGKAKRERGALCVVPQREQTFPLHTSEDLFTHSLNFFILNWNHFLYLSLFLSFLFSLFPISSGCTFYAYLGFYFAPVLDLFLFFFFLWGWNASIILSAHCKLCSL